MDRRKEYYIKITVMESPTVVSHTYSWRIRGLAKANKQKRDLEVHGYVNVEVISSRQYAQEQKQERAEKKKANVQVGVQ